MNQNVKYQGKDCPVVRVTDTAMTIQRQGAPQGKVFTTEVPVEKLAQENSTNHLVAILRDRGQA